MKVACPTCNSNLNIDDGKIPPGGARIKCPSCQNIFPVRPASAGAAVPLPGGSAPPPAAKSGPRPGAVPLPGLTAAAPQNLAHHEEKTRVGDAAPADLQFDEATNTAPPPLRRAAVPLPGGAGPLGIDPAQQRTVPHTRSPAVPLPGGLGAPAAPQPAGFDFQDLPSPKGAALGDAPAYGEAPSFEFEDLPSPAGAPAPRAFEFEDAPPPPAPRARARPAPELDDLPSPALDDLPSPALGDLPMPAESDLPSPASFDFGAASGGLGFDLGAPAEPAPARAPAPAPSFGEVDLGGGSDALEFDPTAAPKQDDLEADLSAPLPPPKATGPADGMEMLGFIDQQAREAGAKDSGVKLRRFHIKRRSGKVFGPFEEAVVVKMLEDGQLLGNEEVSLDTESWQPIGAEAAFQGAIAKLMESPSRSMTTAIPAGQEGAAGGGTAAQNASMERLKQLYEGRMAAVAVVESKLPVSPAARIPLIALGVLLVAGVGTGLFLGTTPYGFFGLKKIFPARVKAGTREFTDLAEARAAMLKDSWTSYQQARDAALKTLKVKEYPEARAVWCQAIFHLQRRYGAARPAELAQANAELENIQLLGKKQVEVVKAMASGALVRGAADEAIAHLADALARSENQGDLELYFLRAEAFVAKRQYPQALSDLKAALDKDKSSARALHAMGEVHLAQKEVDLALGRFGEALKADSSHAASGIELAAILLQHRKDAAKAQEALDAVLKGDERAKLAPSELGRALAYRGEILAGQYKWKEANVVFEEALKSDPGGARAKYSYGKSLLAVSDVEKALPLLKDAYTADPRNIDFVDAYLSALIEKGNMQDAPRVVSDANKQFPGNAKLAYFAARVDDVLDHTKDAEANYLRAVSADPNLVEANLNLARLYLRFRRLKDAKPQLEAAVAKAPDNALVHLGMGELALAERDPDRAGRAYKKVTELDPNMADGYLGLSQVALAQDKLELAAQFADKALQLNPRVHGGRLQRGTTLWKLGKFDEAQRELEQGRADDPRSIALSTTLGAVLLETGDLNGALAALGSALQAEPNNAEANFYVARVKNKKVEHSGAIESMKKALDAAGKKADYNFWMGRIYLDARKPTEARDQWKLALQIDPRHVDTLEALGRLYLEQNKVKDAVQFFERALEVDPQRNAARAAIGDAYSVAERWDDAIKSYTKALEKAPDLPGVHFKLAQAYFERKKYSEAIDWFKKATVKDPENPLAYLNLGWAYKEKKMKPQAVAAFKQYLAKQPDAVNKREIEDQIDYLGGN